MMSGVGATISVLGTDSTMNGKKLDILVSLRAANDPRSPAPPMLARKIRRTLRARQYELAPLHIGPRIAKGLFVATKTLHGVAMAHREASSIFEYIQYELSRS